MAAHTLFYDEPANLWEQATPVGNGRLGAMIRGTTNVERFWMNEDSVWYGGPQERLNPAARANLDTVRDLIDQNRIAEAEKLTMKSFSAMPEGMRHYEPLGDVLVNFGHGVDPPGPDKNVSGIARFENAKYSITSEGDQIVPNKYRRELDLRTGLVTISYEWQGVGYERQVFSSTADQVLCASVTADKPFAFSINLNRGDHDEWDRKTNKCYDYLRHNDNGLILGGSMGGRGAVEFGLGTRVVIEGSGTVEVNGIDIDITAEAGSRVKILVAGETTYRHKDAFAAVKDRLSSVSEKSWNDLVSAHVGIFSPLYSRVELNLGPRDPQAAVPINKRLANVRAGQIDNGLTVLLFHFGRYLLISSSLSGLPPNLQGIWNADVMPVWGSKYTININIQMNYWPAEVTNLPECHDVLFEFLQKMATRGAQVAQEMYGCRGWVVHHNTDLWADCAPQDTAVCASYWNLSGAWFCTHLWQHYLFGRDTEFLKRVFPLMHGSALFFIDFLVERDGKLITSPSLSAENSYYLPGTKQVASLCAGPAWDGQILTELFKGCVQAAKILGHPTAEYEAVLAKLPKPQIGKYGQIMEWKDDVEEVEIGHRHVSHLWGVYPGNSINSDKLKAAAKKTLERRLSAGGGHTSWSLAWMLCLYARLREPVKAEEGIQRMLGNLTLPSMFTTHPPFQIDGNFGFVAAAAEMLLQSQDEGFIDILTCLPPAWSDGGSIKGLRARGQIVVNIIWEKGVLSEISLLSSSTEVQQRVLRTKPKQLTSGSGEMKVVLDPGKALVLSGAWN